MGLNVLVLLSFSGFKFLGEKQRTRKKRSFHCFNKHLLGIWYVARHQATLSVTFSTFKITFNQVKETSRCLIADPVVVPERLFLLRILPELLRFNLEEQLGNITRIFLTGT